MTFRRWLVSCSWWPMRAATRYLSLWAFTLCVACGDSPVPNPGTSIRIDPHGRVLVSNTLGRPGASVGTLRLTEVQRMGSLDSGPQAFGDVVDLAGDGTTIYVSDRLAKEIMAFGPEGDLLRRFGRRGSGPGELRHMLPVSILWQDPNRVWVGEPPSLFLFDSLGTSVARPATLPWSWPWRGHTDTLGSVYSEFTETGPLELRGQVSLAIRSRNVVRHTPVWPRSGQDMGTIELPDTLPLPVLESPTRTLRRGGNYEIRQLPMRPQILWAASPNGAIWVVNTAEYRLNEVTFTGDTVRTIEMDRPQTQLRNNERDSLAAASGFAVSEIPRYRPMMDRLDVAPDGWIWVRRNARDGLVWDIFDTCGRFAGTVSPPMPLDRNPMQLLRGGGLLAVTRDQLDVEFVVRLRLEQTDGTSLHTPNCCTGDCRSAQTPEP